MESSIAEFLSRKLACELLPTMNSNTLPFGGHGLLLLRILAPLLTHQV
jgi:hypothetical protein